MLVFRFITGLEFREPAYLIGPKCEEEVQANMVFIVVVGLQNLTNDGAKDAQSKTTALLISDTVLVNAVSC